MRLPKSEWRFSDIGEEDAIRCCVWEYMRESLPARHRLMPGSSPNRSALAAGSMAPDAVDTGNLVDPPAWQRMTEAEKGRYADIIDQYWRNGSAFPLKVVSDHGDRSWHQGDAPIVRYDRHGERVRVTLEVDLRHFRDRQIIDAFQRQIDCWRAGTVNGCRIEAPSHRGVLHSPSDALSGLVYLMHMRLRHYLGTAGMIRLLEHHPRSRNWKSDLSPADVRQLSDRMRHKGRELYYSLFPELRTYDKSVTLPRSWKTRRSTRGE